LNVDASEIYTKVTANTASTFALDNPSPGLNLEYSFDGKTFTTYSTQISINEGQTLYLKGDNENG
jgi:hypothetical protein